MILLNQLIESSLKRIRKINYFGKNKLEGYKKRALLKMGVFYQKIYYKLNNWVKSFPNLDNLDEKTKKLIDDQFDISNIKKALAVVDFASKKIRQLWLYYRKKIKKSKNPNEIIKLYKKFLARSIDILKYIEDKIELLNEFELFLNKLPSSLFDNSFKIVIVGFPNAGKSTLLKSLTNRNVKIANYPFTTKELNEGKLDFNITLIDTPGIFRDFENSNKIEKLAYDSLNFADFVIFIIDPLQPLDPQLRFIEKLKPNLILISKKDIVDVSHIKKLTNGIDVNLLDKKDIEKIRKIIIDYYINNFIKPKIRKL